MACPHSRSDWGWSMTLKQAGEGVMLGECDVCRSVVRTQTMTGGQWIPTGYLIPINGKLVCPTCIKEELR